MAGREKFTPLNPFKHSEILVDASHSFLVQVDYRTSQSRIGSVSWLDGNLMGFQVNFLFSQQNLHPYSLWPMKALIRKSIQMGMRPQRQGVGSQALAALHSVANPLLPCG